MVRQFSRSGYCRTRSWSAKVPIRSPILVPSLRRAVPIPFCPTSKRERHRHLLRQLLRHLLRHPQHREDETGRQVLLRKGEEVPLPPSPPPRPLPPPTPRRKARVFTAPSLGAVLGATALSHSLSPSLSPSNTHTHTHTHTHSYYVHNALLIPAPLCWR